eukprot:CAMPEP_0171258928 /NCGR_PEP_ID=MMETSP0790-20130122/54655_1 /TAXON_ID=2925 /ORGANISM="Alexandrium catenella, Strain OF101" /LENGTH=392 /DNA_ID=CAMNT_0011727167 /DNA_START=21 /DNA_END=1199 /DNA_ORIENTATION=+
MAVSPPAPLEHASAATVAAAGRDMAGYVFMALVALQVGVQPAMTRACVNQAVSGRSLVLAEMAISMALAIAIVPQDAFSGWSASESVRLAGPPAVMYAFRSLLKQAAYRRCDGVTFNIFNQTKVVFCALAAWALLGEGQTLQQCAALFCAVCAGALLVTPARSSSSIRLLMCCGGNSPSNRTVASGEGEGPKCAKAPEVAPKGGEDSCAKEVDPPEQRPPPTATSGVGSALALGTAVCSGTAAALSQAALAGSVRPSALFNLELALWGVPFVILSGGRENPFKVWRAWQMVTIVPVLLQAIGGLLVSAVVKQQGGVAMGLCTVAGIGVSAVVDAIVTRRLPSVRQVTAAGLCALSVVVHQWDATASRHPVPLSGIQVPAPATGAAIATVRPG